MERFVIDVIKSAIGLFIGIAILFALLRLGRKLPNGLGGVFQTATKLVTPGQ